MKIVIATPLYPPEIGGAARYSKELARRLSRQHSVTVVAYSRYPEVLPRVRVVMVRKNWPLVIRLPLYTIRLFLEVLRADAVIAENGPSVELPIMIVTALIRRPFIFHLGDQGAHARAEKKSFWNMVENALSRRARKTIVELIPERPEIRSFEPFPADALAKWEDRWEAEITTIATALHE